MKARVNMQVNILQAKNQLSQLIKYAQAGDEVVIANRGAPVAQLISLSPSNTSRSSPKLGFLHWLETNPLPTHAQQTAQEIDASIAEQRSSWE
jgi:prevent-host-death family protein